MRFFNGHRLAAGFFVFVIGMVLSARAAIPGDLATPQNLLDPKELSSEWQELLDGLQPGEALEANFREQRENDFRRGHRIFRGVLRVWGDRGVSLRYEGAIDVTLVAAPGAVWRRPADGAWTSYAVDPDTGMAAWSRALWNLDLAALGELFTIHGRQAADERWELLLTPTQDRRLPRIYLQGDPRALTHLEVEHNPRRRTLYALENINRAPDTGSWARFFPKPE